MALVEIQLNRLGINSVEFSPDTVDASPGTAVHVHIRNFGTATHITLKADGSEYTSYTYDNLYIEGETEVHIPLLSSAPDGIFSVQMITGYGMRRDEFKVVVHQVPTNVEPEESDSTEQTKKRKDKAKSKKQKSSQPSKAGRVALAMIAPVLALAFLVLWAIGIISSFIISPLLMGIIIFLIMLIGVFVAWFSAK